MRSGIKHLNDWLIAFLLMVGIGFADIMITGGGMYKYNLFTYLNPFPITTLSGLDSLASIYLFNGEAIPDMRFSYNTFSVLTSMIILLLLSPWMLYKGYSKAEESDSHSKPWYWYFGASFCLWALAVIPALILSFRVDMNIREGSAEVRVEDQMRSELTDVSFKAVEYAILEDGFGDSFHVEQLGMDDLAYRYKVTSDTSGATITITVMNTENEDVSFSSRIDPSNTGSFFKIR